MIGSFRRRLGAQLGCGFAATGLTLGVMAGPALAHTDPQGFVPGPCSVVDAASEVLVTFSEELGPDSAGTLLDGAGLAIADLVVDLDDLGHRTLRAEPVGTPQAPLRLNPGHFRVTWEAVSAVDDDLTVGSYGFSVEQAAAPADCALRSDEESSSGLQPAVLGGAALSSVAALGLLSRRREPAS